MSNLFGALSYPIFLTHWYASGLVLYFFGEPKNTLANLLYSLPLALVVSFVLVVLVDRPIARVRARVRMID